MKWSLTTKLKHRGTEITEETTADFSVSSVPLCFSFPAFHLTLTFGDSKPNVSMFLRMEMSTKPCSAGAFVKHRGTEVTEETEETTANFSVSSVFFLPARHSTPAFLSTSELVPLPPARPPILSIRFLPRSRHCLTQL